VDYSSLVGANATCRGCNWKGTSTELLVVPIKHEFLADEHIIRDMMSGMRQLLAGELGLPYLKFLLKWGFLEGDIARAAATIDRKKFARYIAAIAQAILMAIIDTRAKLATEAAPPEGKAN
jgi:hypothetical protein